MNEQYDYERRLGELTEGIDTTFANIFEPFIYGNISKYLQNGKMDTIDVLDVGCGCGFLTARIAEKFPEANVEGIDISESAINCAKAHFNLKFTHLDVLDLDEKKKVDVVVYNMVLHNLQKFNLTVQKTSSILKSKGIVLVTIPHPAFWLPDKISSGKIILNEPFNYNVETFYQIPFKIKNGSVHETKLTYYHRRLTTYMNTFSKYLKIVVLEEVDIKNSVPTMLRVILEKRI